MKTLVLYYSHGGNTAGIAQRIGELLACDAAEIQPVVPYAKNYNAVVEQGQREIQSAYEPEVKPLKFSPADYDTIILGTPVWWYTFAPPVKTILSAVDWTGKALYPFATNAGWLGHTFQDIENACVGADVKRGLNIRFNEKHLVTSEDEINKWIDQIKEE